MGTVNIWILKFIPYEGPSCHSLFFKTRDTAIAVRAAAMTVDGARTFRDDFGLELSLDTSKCAIVLTDCDTSAAFAAAVINANRHAEKKYGLPQDILSQQIQ